MPQLAGDCSRFRGHGALQLSKISYKSYWLRVVLLAEAVATMPWLLTLTDLTTSPAGSFGTSMAQTLQERRLQFHDLRLGESLDPFNPAVQSFLDQTRATFLQQTGDPAAAQQLALQALDNLREQQASALAYFDVFWLLAVLAILLVPLVLLMKRSVAEKGTGIAAE